MIGLKTSRIWAIFFVLAALAGFLAYFSGTVYDGNEGNLDLARGLFLGFWICVIAAAGVEGWLVARFYSRLSDRPTTVIPFVVLFGVLAFCGFSPIGLMSIFGLPIVGFLLIFTAVFFFLSTVEYIGERRAR